MSKAIYLDYNATSPLRPGVIAKVTEQLQENLARNPSSIHVLGLKARKMVEDARQGILRALGTTRHDLIFTSSATESNNLLIKNFIQYPIITSVIEHQSISNILPNGATLVGVNEECQINMAELEEHLDRLHCIGKVPLVSIMWVNNQTGAIQDMSKISDICKKYGALLHSDASQAVGRVHMDLGNINIDFLTLSSHKMGGLHGASALLIPKGFKMTPIVLGGGQERNMRSSTENTLAIVSMSIALQECISQMPYEVERLSSYKNLIVKEMSQSGAYLISPISSASNTICISMPKVDRKVQCAIFDMHNICVGTSSACSSGKEEEIHVLKNMGLEESITSTLIRVSMGHGTCNEDVHKFIKTWRDISQRLAS